MAAADPADLPRKGQYMNAVTYVDQEGGGTLEFRTAVCKTCGALVDDAAIDGHMGLHEALGQGGSGPK